MPQIRKRPPARTPEEEENYMIRISIQAAEDKILSGKASSQLLCHYLKLATQKERLEKEKLENEITLLKAKTEAIEAAKHTDEMFAAAMRAMSIYTGSSEMDDEDDYDDE